MWGFLPEGTLRWVSCSGPCLWGFSPKIVFIILRTIVCGGFYLRVHSRMEHPLVHWNLPVLPIMMLISLFYKELGKTGFMQNSLELHQPNMHTGFRVISIECPPQCHLPDSILMESDPLCCKFYWLQVIQLTSEVFVKGFRVCNQHVFACGNMKLMETHCYCNSAVYYFKASFMLCNLY